MRWMTESRPTVIAPVAIRRRASALSSAIAIVALVSLAAPAGAQPYPHFKTFTDHLAAIASVADATERGAQLTTLLNDLRAAGRIPFTEGDSVAFLWRGSATGVSVPGDHSGWSANGQAMTKIGLSDVWMRVYRFPEAARIDYKFVVGSNWIMDPNNPHTQMGGFGPNSELRMPAWVFPTETVRTPNVPSGTLSPNQTLASTSLGYPVRYRVFTPFGYDGLADLPVIYVTDGHEYLDDALGAVRIVMDNLVAEGRVPPAIVVFIDPRSVTSGTNQRQAQYVQNPKFADFVALELAPAIDAAYRTRPHPEARIILGTSLGGVFSLYLGLQHPTVFGRLAIQSPAFWVTESAQYWSGPSLFQMAEWADPAPFRVYMSSGTIGDAAPEARRMRDILLGRGWDLTYREVPEGHSWGNWRALIDEAAIALLSAAPVRVEPGVPATAAAARLEAWPNPSNRDVTFAWEARAAGDLACFDLQGRLVARAAAEAHHAGRVERTLRFDASGTYLCRLSDGATTPFVGRAASTRVVSVAR